MRVVFFIALSSKRAITSLITISKNLTATWCFSAGVSKPDTSYNPARNRASDKQP